MVSHTDLQLQKKRTKYLFLIFALIGVITFGRLFQLQILEYKTYAETAKKQHWSQYEIKPKRGTIYVKDMDGSLYPLATDVTLNKAFVDLANCNNQDKTAENLANILSIDKNTILNLFKNPVSRRYIPIKNKLTDQETQAIKNLDDPAIGLEPESWRVYPEDTLASQVLGYVNGDDNGVGGIEEYFNNELKGTPGLYKAESDSLGNKILTGRDVSVPAKDGQDIVLTINRDVQVMAEETLANAIKKYGGKSGSITVMDPKTGAIIAMANNPTFDPNNYNDVKDYSLFKNSTISNVYEPGSIFKAVTLAAGLDTGKITPDSSFTDTGSITLDGYTIKNALLKAYGKVNMTFVLEYSLNTGSTYVQRLLGKDLFYSYLEKFGFGIPTGIEAPEGTEASGILNKPADSNDHTYATMSFGQSIAVTPLQMITAYSAIANGGKMMKPYLLEGKVVDGHDVGGSDEKPGKQIISEAAAAKLTQMLVDTVDHGEGHLAKVPGYRVAGKTGTAQVPDPNGGYYSDREIGSFVGFAPADNPKFVVMAKIDEPKNVDWAELSAAPTVGEMLQKLLNYYQIPPTENK